MKTIKTILAALVLTVGSLTIANAQTRFHVSVNTPGVHVSAGNYVPYHRVYYSEPVVYSPPVVYREPVVYHRYYSRPVVYHRYYSRPVVYRSYDRYDRRDFYRHDNGRHLGQWKHGRH
ncbi:hypothetical protein HQ865_21060 [Mucilaginibacter mali]|uniref:Uncharacterized protein n=1 Tax=Mucilaginibacter mali TaxID=2740462 RepID=A0A7D4Q3C9_9SPHI|nr:hypothetical protein [Mucilaginibacter mali]QKJ32146.1 hypothetical protein HQ865_21060 [Mucilaginibacter mali]